jgi:chorismate mutase
MPSDPITQLAECRERIDRVDLRILELLNERTVIVERIGNIKKQAQLAIYEPRREEQVFHNITSNNSGPLPDEGVKRIFERIIDEMRRVQKLRMEEKG